MKHQSKQPSFLLVGPYDPHCGEYTFLAPPLGVWRLVGVLEQAGFLAEVFDPNLCGGAPEAALEAALSERAWDVVGVSTTGMTLRYDLSLAHLAHRTLPSALFVAGGMEATFQPELMFELAPFDMVVLGEGEKPLLEIGERLRSGQPVEAINGTAWPGPSGVVRRHRPALTREELRDAIFQTPYHKMPYARYWERLQEAYRIGALPEKAQREARLAEVRSVRLNTLNYCPMNCTFCSSTNFLHAAENARAKVGRLDAAECMEMIEVIVHTQPGVRTIIFQDDIFVFTKDTRILPLCEMILEAKASGRIPADLQFISTNRIDAMERPRLEAMRRAGFRVLGFGIENFSRDILTEFNKERIYPYIEPNLTHALELGLKPFLDIILTSPRSRIEHLAETVEAAFAWIEKGCEIGIYPYIIPFSGAVMAADPALRPATIYARQSIPGTSVHWEQPVKIPPLDPILRRLILAAEKDFEHWLSVLQERVAHLPSRLRSLLWILSASYHLRAAGYPAPTPGAVTTQLLNNLPTLSRPELEALQRDCGWDVPARQTTAATA